MKYPPESFTTRQHHEQLVCGATSRACETVRSIRNEETLKALANSAHAGVPTWAARVGGSVCFATHNAESVR